MLLNFFLFAYCLFNLASQPVTLTSPIQQIDVETVVTRTERHVHHSEDINEPVVDERVTTQIFRDGQQVKNKRRIFKKTSSLYSFVPDGTT